MTSVKRQFERAISDLLRELEAVGPMTLTLLIEGLSEHYGCTRDEAIRMLAEFETTAKELLEASRSMGEA